MPTSLRILHIEDDSIVRSFVFDRYKGSLQIDSVETLAAALILLETTPYDILLVDLYLPDSKGMATVAALTKYGVPIVVASAEPPTTQFVDDALKLGVSDYLSKPALPLTDLAAKLLFVREKARKSQGVAAAPRKPLFQDLEAIKPYLTCAVLVAGGVAKLHLVR